MASSPMIGSSIIAEKPPEKEPKLEKPEQPMKKWTTQILRMLGIRGQD